MGIPMRSNPAAPASLAAQWAAEGLAASVDQVAEAVLARADLAVDAAGRPDLPGRSSRRYLLANPAKRGRFKSCRSPARRRKQNLRSSFGTIAITRRTWRTEMS